MMNSKEIKYYSVGLVLITLVLSGCIGSESRPSEGVIKYKITYLDDAKQNPIINLLPSTMTMYFKDNSTIAKIDGFMGLFSFAYLVDFENKKNSTMVRIVDVKYVYEVPIEQLSYGYGEMDDMQIMQVDEIRDIIGYQCNKAVVTYTGNPDPIYLYYTNEIGIVSPNTNNPFKDIEGVLLEFQVNLNSINMQFEATSIQFQDVEDSEFEVPEGFQPVTEQEISEFINSYMAEKPVNSNVPPKR